MDNNIELLYHRYVMVLAIFLVLQVVHANSYIGGYITKHGLFRIVETSHHNVINTTSFHHPSVSQFTCYYAMGCAIPDIGSHKGSQQIYLQYISINQHVSEYESDLPEPDQKWVS